MAEEATSGASGTGAPGEAIYVSDDAETSRPASQASSFLVEFNHEENTPPDLRGALDGIKPAGSFASFNTLSSLNLGLAVQDVGTIAMPLQEPQAKQIIEKARRSPYGKGEETVVDMSVRNTWELDPDQFELQGTGWESLLTVMLGHVKKSLGVASPIRAELYKMLLYEPGAMFKSHTDSPKIANMFGTLVLVLPSPHQGGEVVLRHRDKKKVFHSSHVVQGFMSWYSDVQHEVLPVTQGYRWVLTYNLAPVDPCIEPPLASSQRLNEVAKLSKELQKWLSRSGESQIYTLDHNYTEARISFQDLKGRNASVVQALRDISTKLPVDIFLGILEKEDMGSCEDDPTYFDKYDHYHDDEDDEDEEEEEEYRPYRGQDDTDEFHTLIDIFGTTYHIKKLVDLTGTCLGVDLPLDSKSFLAPDSFDKGDVKEIDYDEGFSGNEGGPNATHVYRISGVIILPHFSTLSFMQSAQESGTTNRNSILGYYSSKCKDPAGDQALFLILKALCEHIWGPVRTYRAVLNISREVSRLVLQAAVRMRDWGFFATAAEMLKGGFDNDFCLWIMGEVANGLPFECVKEPLDRVVVSFPHLRQSLEVINAIAPPALYDPLGSDKIQEWAHVALKGTLDAPGPKIFENLDGEILISRCATCYDVEYIQTHIVPVLEKQAKEVPFVLGALHRIAELTRSETDKRDLWLNIFERVAAALISSIQIADLISRKTLLTPVPVRQIWERPPESPVDPTPKRPSCAIESPWLVGFFKDMLSLTPTRDFSTSLAQKLSGAADQIKSAEFGLLWVPFLQQFITVLEENSVLAVPQYQQVFVALLGAYIKNYVGKEVRKDNKTLERPRVNCSCMDCQNLNAFLVDPNRGIGRFSVNKSRRQHLHNKLDNANIDCQHVTERVGSPQTLVVSKTFKQLENTWRKWSMRKIEAQRVLRAFPKETLHTLLGMDYPRIFHMNDIMWSAWNAGNQPAAVPGPSMPSRPRPGQKRKADEEIEVVDLTEFD